MNMKSLIGCLLGVIVLTRPVGAHEQFTDVWVKMPTGAWQCVATHGTLIKK